MTENTVLDVIRIIFSECESYIEQISEILNLDDPSTMCSSLGVFGKNSRISHDFRIIYENDESRYFLSSYNNKNYKCGNTGGSEKDKVFVIFIKITKNRSLLLNRYQCPLDDNEISRTLIRNYKEYSFDDLKFFIKEDPSMVRLSDPHNFLLTEIYDYEFNNFTEKGYL